MDYASANGFVVFTHDLDFGALLAGRKTRYPSVVQIRAQDVLPKSIGEIVVHALGASVSHLEAGALVTIDPSRSRIRLLPIQ
jgi:predicted nuclease of predicted toxin-antitoxin system